MSNKNQNKKQKQKLATPTVHIIMPAYNSAQTIERAIKSVQAQHYKNWKLHIAENGSTDGTFQICQKLAETDERILPEHNENNNYYYCLRYFDKVSRMLVESDPQTDALMACLDSDDEYKPHFLEDMTKFMLKNELDFATTWTTSVDMTGKVLPQQSFSGPAETFADVEGKDIMLKLWMPILFTF